MIRQYMFGTEVLSDWKEGSTIVWKGEWKGKAYEDKGKILAIVPEKKLQYTHFSTLYGEPDTAENHHIVSFTLSGEGDQTTVTITQDNNADEKAVENAKKMWEMLLTDLKKLLEK